MMNECLYTASVPNKRCEGIQCDNDAQCYSNICFKNSCTGLPGCHTNTLYIYRCPGVVCNLDFDCASGFCVGGTCSTKKACATANAAYNNKCEGVYCVGDLECQKTLSGFQSCIGGTCSSY